MKFSLTSEFREKLRSEINNSNIKFIENVFKDISYVDITELLYEFDSEESKYILDNINSETSAQIISELDQDTREKFLKIYSNKEIASYLEFIDSDDGADILSELDEEDKVDIILNISDKQKSKDLKDLLKYDDNVAGGLMAKELVKRNINWKISQCINLIKKQAEKVSMIYTV